MDKAIQNFIEVKRLAVVGVSRDQKKFGNTIYKELKSRGFQVFAVNPSMKEIEGEPCYPDLASLKGKVDGVVICVQPAKAVEVVKDAAGAGIQNVWFQQGSDSPDALKAAQELGLNTVSKKCILMYAPPVHSYHKFHRTIIKLVGQL